MIAVIDHEKLAGVIGKPDFRISHTPYGFVRKASSGQGFVAPVLKIVTNVVYSSVK